MKWFKHQSTARNDERIARLEDKAGLEGYGFYFKMLELVAENVDSTNRCEVTYSISRWGRQTNITTKKFLFLTQCCSNVGLMIAQRVGDDMTVKIPNLLKYRDNHTKNLQAACKQDTEEDKDTETEKEGEKKKDKAAAAAPPLTNENATTDPKKTKHKKSTSEMEMLKNAGVDEQVTQDFLKNRKAKRTPLTQTALNGIAREAEKAGISTSEAVQICAERGWQSFNASWDWKPKQNNQTKATNRFQGNVGAIGSLTTCENPPLLENLTLLGVSHE